MEVEDRRDRKWLLAEEEDRWIESESSTTRSISTSRNRRRPLRESAAESIVVVRTRRESLCLPLPPVNLSSISSSIIAILVPLRFRRTSAPMVCILCVYNFELCVRYFYLGLLSFWWFQLLLCKLGLICCFLFLIMCCLNSEVNC